MSNTARPTLALVALAAALVAGAVVAAPDSDAAPSSPTSYVRPAVDLATWQTKPCATEDSVNCRYISTNPGGHTFSVRLLPGRERMVCVFYADRRYAATHDYCTTTR